MEIANLHAFVAVSETESFSEAAHELFITQSAVSKRISNLETSLNQKLFDRIGRSCQLTSVGEALLPKAKQILNAIDDAKTTVDTFSTEISGSLNFGTSHHIGLHHLPPLLKNFTENYPGVKVNISFLDSEAACEQVLAGKLEFAMVTLPNKPIENLHQSSLWHDKLSFVIKPGHPWAHAEQVPLTDLANEPAILTSLNTYTRRILNSQFELKKIKLQSGIATNYLETIKMLVGVGLGWSVLPNTMLGPEISAFNVKGIAIARKLGVVTHAQRTLSNAANTFIAIKTS